MAKVLRIFNTNFLNFELDTKLEKYMDTTL